MRGASMKYMKYIGIISIALFLSVSLIPLGVHATPPRYINIQYQANTHTLKVTISHITPVRSIHYIYRIVVEKNGVLDQVHFYSKQPRFFLNTYEYNMSANPGDVITVSAYCVLFGYNSRSITVS